MGRAGRRRHAAAGALRQQLALRPAPASGDNARRRVGPADLLPRPAHGRPGLPRRERRRSCGSRPRRLRRPTTARSSRPSVWGTAPSTPWSPGRLADARPSSRRHERGRRSAGDAAHATSSCRTPIRGPRPWPGRSPPRDATTYDKVRGPDRLDGPTHPLLDQHPAACPGRRLRSTSSSSATGSASASRSPPRWPSCCAPSAFRPAKPSATSRAATTRSPTSTRCRPNDAHAWVQVWFPGYGWQSFDPTAVGAARRPEPGCHRVARRRGRPRACPVGARRSRRRSDRGLIVRSCGFAVGVRSSWAARVAT